MARPVRLAGVLLAPLGLALMASCTPAVRPVSPAVLATAGELGLATDTTRLEAGRAIYVQHCGSCHQLYPTSALNEARWREAIIDMAPKAHLDAAQTALLHDYLLSAHRTP